MASLAFVLSTALTTIYMPGMMGAEQTCRGQVSADYALVIGDTPWLALEHCCWNVLMPGTKAATTAPFEGTKA